MQIDMMGEFMPLISVAVPPFPPLAALTKTGAQKDSVGIAKHPAIFNEIAGKPPIREETHQLGMIIVLIGASDEGAEQEEEPEEAEEVSTRREISKRGL